MKAKTKIPLKPRITGFFKHLYNNNVKIISYLVESLGMSLLIFLALGLFYKYNIKLYFISFGLYFVYKEIVKDFQRISVLRGK